MSGKAVAGVVIVAAWTAACGGAGDSQASEEGAPVVEEEGVLPQATAENAPGRQVDSSPAATTSEAGREE